MKTNVHMWNSDNSHINCKTICKCVLMVNLYHVDIYVCVWKCHAASMDFPNSLTIYHFWQVFKTILCLYRVVVDKF